ncbi:Alpha-amylase 1 [Leucoagaricus sp. SymC.cos]|nr:Alpha-amylase 1 [Leucoagaricus sp. SymC.cos]
MFFSSSILLSFFVSFHYSCAATAEQWRGRSIYQLITDRFALPEGVDRNACDPGKQSFCGGTWNTIRENLDYIQNAGFTAIWISPINQNYEGPRTAYGDPYHGYWIQDISKLNSRFGTADDLNALTAEIHRRGMYIMVDIVVNNVMSTSTQPDYSKYFFNNATFYHPYCPISWGNTTSEQNCWLGDEKVPLPDVDTANPTVIAQYGDWIQGLVKEYNIDGLRIDAAKHVQMDFWPQFCAKAGVFCMGEIFGDVDVEPIAQYQGPQALDSVLNFPLYSALMECFAIPGPRNTSAVQNVLEQSKIQFRDTGLLGNFLENQDVPRWHNKSVDPQSLYNAMVLNWLTDGIPIVYYGQEQSFSGSADPYNREPLWTSGYQETDAYNFIKTLNQFRNFLVTTDWLKQETRILTSGPVGLAVMKGQVISIATSIGSPPQNGTHIAVPSPYDSGTSMTNILTCQQWVVGSKGFLDVEYTKGGVPVILMPSNFLQGSGLCGNTLTQNVGSADRHASFAIVSTSVSLLYAVSFSLLFSWFLI